MQYTLHLKNTPITDEELKCDVIALQKLIEYVGNNSEITELETATSSCTRMKKAEATASITC